MASLFVRQQNKKSISYRASYLLLFLSHGQFADLVRDDGECLMVYNVIKAANDKGLDLYRPQPMLDGLSIIGYLYKVKDYQTIPQELRTKAHTLIFVGGKDVKEH